MEKDYKISVNCDNCGYKGTKLIKFGYERPREIICSECGCQADTGVYIPSKKQIRM